MSRTPSPRHPSVAGRRSPMLPKQPSLEETQRLWIELVARLELEEMFSDHEPLEE